MELQPQYQDDSQRSLLVLFVLMAFIILWTTFLVPRRAPKDQAKDKSPGLLSTKILSQTSDDPPVGFDALHGQPQRLLCRSYVCTGALTTSVSEPVSMS